MTGSTRERQFKDWLKRKYGGKFKLQKILSEGLPDYYCSNTGFFIEVKYRESGGPSPIKSLFSKEQWKFLEFHYNVTLIGYRTGKYKWRLFTYDAMGGFWRYG